MGAGWLPAKTQLGELRQPRWGGSSCPDFWALGLYELSTFNEHVFLSVYFHRVRLISCSKNETLAWKWHICQLMSTVDVQSANRISCCGKSWVTICFNSVFFVSDILRVKSKRISFLLKKKRDKNTLICWKKISWRKMLWYLPTE